MNNLNLSHQIELKILDPRLNAWGLPSYQSTQAAAVDLYACIISPIELWPDSKPVLIPVGFAIHINDPNIAAVILPRSGLGHKEGLIMGNGTGLIDGDYTGPIYVSAWNRNASGSLPIRVIPGDRIAQMLFVPVIQATWTIVENFSAESERGGGGFGSTGR